MSKNINIISEDVCTGCGACNNCCPVDAIEMLEDQEGFKYPNIDMDKCISCGKCKKVCPMNVDITDNSRKRKNGTECILCMECVRTCPRKAL